MNYFLLVIYWIVTCCIHDALGSDRTPVGFDKMSAVSYFSPEEMMKVQPLLQDFANFPNSEMWEAEADNISVHHPFILFHQRKSGGTDLRKSLLLYAHEHNLPHRIPCYDKVKCDMYDIPTYRPMAIYAGHFQWGEQHQLSRFNGQRLELEYSCLTNYREPVSRIISCIYFRFERYFRNLNSTCISELSDENLLELLVIDTDRYGNSCLNEPFRMLSGLTDESLLNTLGNNFYDEHRNISTFDPEQLKPKITTLAVALMDSTLEHMKKCAPKILEYPASMESDHLLQRKFPSMFAKGAFRDVGNQMPPREYSSNCSAPRDGQVRMIEKFAAFEKLLYDAVVSKVHSAYEEFKI